MANPVDPNEVLMTGENSFIRLSRDAGKTLADRASHWRVLWCPAGAGTVLFLPGALRADRAQRPLRHRAGVGGAARRPPVLQRVPGVVGELGQAARLTTTRI